MQMPGKQIEIDAAGSALKWLGLSVLLCTLVLALAARNAQAQPLRLIVFGDSLVQGYGLPADDGFVAQLQRWLENSGQDVEIVNAGVSGETTQGGRARIGWTLGEPADAIIIALGGNDALRGLDPAITRKNLDVILQIAKRKGIEILLVGIRSPGNFGTGYAREFNSIFPDLAAKHDVALYENFLAVLARQTDRSTVLETYFQADALHPNEKGIALIVEDIGPQVRSLLERAAQRKNN